MVAHQEDYPYRSLPGVVLQGLTVWRCQGCDAHEVDVPDPEGLHRALVNELVRKRERLAPSEIRFLRKYLGYSSKEFAEHIGVSPETVSRWETGAQSMAPVADRLVRLMALTKEPVGDYIDTMDKVGRLDVRPYEGKLRRLGNTGWETAV